MDARKQPCKKDCKNRSARCHADCEIYLAWHEAHKAELAKKERDRINYENYYELIRQRTRRIYKRTGKK